jgi:hypothetical protein
MPSHHALVPRFHVPWSVETGKTLHPDCSVAAAEDLPADQIFRWATVAGFAPGAPGEERLTPVPVESGSCKHGSFRAGLHCASGAAWTGPVAPLSHSAVTFRLGTSRQFRSDPHRERLRRRLTRDPCRANAGYSLWHSDADSAGGGSGSNCRGNCDDVGSEDRSVPDGGGVSECRSYRHSRARECRDTHGSGCEPLKRLLSGGRPFLRC